MEKKKIVIRVDENEFELEDGTIHPHFETLEETPDLDDFQKIYDYWRKTINECKRKANKH